MIKNLRRRLAIVFTAFTGTVLAVVLVISLWLNVQQTLGNSQLYFSIASSEVVNYLAYLEEGDTGALTQLEHEQGLIIDISDGENSLEFTYGWQPKSPRDVLVQLAQDATLNDEMQPEMLMVQYATSPVYISITEDLAPIEGTDAAFPTKPASDIQTEASPALPAESDVIMESTDAYTFSIATMVQFSAERSIQVEGPNGDKYRCATFLCRVDQADYNITILQDLSRERQNLLWLYIGYALLLLFGLFLLFLINWFLAKMVIKPTAEGIQRQTNFVAAASHELRSPLAVIRSCLAAAQASPTEAQALKHRAAADAEAARMGRLVDDLLLLAGGDAGSWSLQSGPVDIDTLLIETNEHFAPIAKEKKIALLLQLPDDALGEIPADKDRLHQILTSLLDNALEYAKDTITLRATRKKNRMEIEVADNGPGISDAEKERVFLRFHRADESRTGKEHFGLGLSVAKELAEVQRGSLTVQDTPGGGATFVLSLPLKEKRPAGKNKK